MQPVEEPREAQAPVGTAVHVLGLTKGHLRSCDGTTKIHAKQEAHLLVVGKCNVFVHVEENESPDVVQQLQGRRCVKVHSRYRCQWTSHLKFADKKHGEEFLRRPVQTHTHTHTHTHKTGQ